MPYSNITTLTTNNSISQMMLKVNELVYNINAISGGRQVWHVSPIGSDSNNGASGSPFLTIKAACLNIALTANGNPSLLKIASGDYYEQLPIIVPRNTALLGDSIRTTFIYPKAGVLSDDGITLNENSKMFLMSNGTIAKFIALKGMTGWVSDQLNPSKIENTVPRGIGFALNPASPIYSASPYINDCSAFFQGGIGVYVDGHSQRGGNKSMLCHAFTNLNNDGVGYWADNGGKLEMVSCFTYYSHFHYVTSRGGQIRSLNGSNSWGYYGSSSEGYLPEEIPITGTIYGDQLIIDTWNGIINIGDTIIGSLSNAHGTVLYIEDNKIFYKQISGFFVQGESITCAGGTALIQNSAYGVTGQTGKTLIVSGFTIAPQISGSITITDDSSSYIIRGVTGTFVNQNSILRLSLIENRTIPTEDNKSLTVRYIYSQIRLTGHDLLNIGTGNIISTNLPNPPLNPPIQANEINEVDPGRVYYVTTDQSGNFRVGDYFTVDQGTGTVTLNPSEFNISGTMSVEIIHASGNITTESILNVNGGVLNSTANTFYLLPSPRDIRLGQTANNIYIGSATGTIFANNNVEIVGHLHVNKDMNASANVNILKDLNVTANTNLLSFLNVSNNINASANVNILKDLNVNDNINASANVNILKYLSVTKNINASANVNILKDLNVTANTNLLSFLNVTGISTFTSNVSINSGFLTTTLGTFNILPDTGNINIGASNTGITIVRNDTQIDGRFRAIKDVTLDGSLIVKGAITTIDTDSLIIKDKNIEIGVVASPTNITADGGGITLKGAVGGNKTITWGLSNNNWTSSENWNLSSTKVYKINNIEVLSSNSLGSVITGSYLTSVGTITIGVWNGSTIDIARGGTNITSYTKGDVLYASANNVLTKLPIGSADQLFQVTSDGLVHWIGILDGGDY